MLELRATHPTSAAANRMTRGNVMGCLLFSHVQEWSVMRCTAELVGLSPPAPIGPDSSILGAPGLKGRACTLASFFTPFTLESQRRCSRRNPGGVRRNVHRGSVR